MKSFLVYEKGYLLPALFLSASIHGLLIGAGGWISSMPNASVIRAPSSLEITVIHQPGKAKTKYYIGLLFYR